MLPRIIFCILLLFFSTQELRLTSFAQDAPQQALLIIASNNFRDEELFLPRAALEKNGIKVIIASSSLALARGMLGATVKPDILLKDVEVAEYDAVIFIGGSGAEEFWDDPVAHRIAVQAQAKEMLIGAICIAPLTLAKAGVLKEKKATVWPSLGEELRAYGAKYSGNDLEIDKNIITANGPKQAEKFAQALVSALLKQR